MHVLPFVFPDFASTIGSTPGLTTVNRVVGHALDLEFRDAAVSFARLGAASPGNPDPGGYLEIDVLQFDPGIGADILVAESGRLFDLQETPSFFQRTSGSVSYLQPLTLEIRAHYSDGSFDELWSGVDSLVLTVAFGRKPSDEELDEFRKPMPDLFRTELDPFVGD